MSQIQKETTNTSPALNKAETESSPFIEWKFKYNEKTGKQEFDLIQMSDGSEINEETFIKAIQKASGTPDPKVGERIVKKVARGLSSDTFDLRINEASSLLPALEPKSTAEALLLGQFLTLNDSGMKCLRLANIPDQGFYHVEKLYSLAHKLLNTANQTMQTVIKYRSGGQQTIQVVHMHNEGQAIVAQNLSPSSKG